MDDKKQEIKKLTIVGAGFMGHNIAAAALLSNVDVLLIDMSAEILQEAPQKIEKILFELEDLQMIEPGNALKKMERLTISEKLEFGLKNCDLFLECIQEDLDAKRSLFEEIDKIGVNENVIIATNTSSFSISELQKGRSFTGRFIGFHWVNPPYLIPVVEIIPGSNTEEQTIAWACNIVEQLGKTPVICKDSPGFIINRLQLALLNEAAKMVETGVASPKEIENAIRLSIGLRLPFFGPLGSSDFAASKKTLLSTLEYLTENIGPHFAPTQLLREKCEKGELGFMTGKGWLDYSHYDDNGREMAVKRRNELIAKLITLLKEEGVLETPFYSFKS